MIFTVVQFTANGARIHQGADAEKLAADPNCLVNPEFPPGVPPHLWRREGDKIGVMDNGPAPRPRKIHRPTFALAFLVGALAGLVIGLLF